MVYIRRMVSPRRIAFAHDVIVGFLAFVVGFSLRLDLVLVGENLVDYLLTGVAFGGVVGVLGLTLGMNRGVWRYASLPDLLAIVKVASLAVVLFIVAFFLLRPLEIVPRSSMAITWAFLIIGLAGPRVCYRLYRDRRDSLRFQIANGKPSRRVLLLGATDEADLFLKSLSERSKAAFDVRAIIDERGTRAGRFIRGVPIVGFDRLPQTLERLRASGQAPDALIITRQRKEMEKHIPLERLMKLAGDEGLELLRVPDMLAMQEVNAKLDVHPVRLEDLLQRPTADLHGPGVESLIRDRRVLITGAGGSIGSELCRQIATLRPSALILLDANEFLLYSIEQDMRTSRPDLCGIPVLCNVRERDAVQQVMAEHRPDVVFHAAALKHVPLVEAQPLEGLFTNAIGTRNVAEAAMRAGVRAMVVVSTDKAVNPANVMGATKRLSEMFCQAMDLSDVAGSTRFLTVRFGNVLGSAGSVVPLFEKQLAAGGPLTVTHPDIERYFMTIPEACTLVLQSAAYGLSSPQERGRIFVLDMGVPVKIVDLARNLIRLSGLRPDDDVKIVYTGLRPGEKLYEELFDRDETLAKTDAESIMMAFPRAIERAIVVRIFDELQRLIAARDTAGALRLLISTVPEFRPGSEIRAMIGDKTAAPSADTREMS